MHIESIEHKNTNTVSLDTRLELASVEAGLFVFERTITLDAKGKKLVKTHGLTIQGKQSGFVDQQNMEQLVNNQPFTVLDLAIWTPEQLEQARLEGFSSVAEMGFSKPSPLALLKERPELTVDNLVREDWSSHMLFDRQGGVLPVAVHFNYIDSGVDNSHYDLEALAEALLALPDIQVLSREPHVAVRTKKGYAPASQTAKTVKEAIFQIPSYNAYEGRTHSVQFIWNPSKEDYARVWEWAKQKDPKHARSRIRDGFFALDVHGLSRFGRTPPEE